MTHPSQPTNSTDKEIREILDKVCNWGAYDGDPRRNTMDTAQALTAINSLFLEAIGEDEEPTVTLGDTKVLARVRDNKLRNKLRTEQRSRWLDNTSDKEDK